MASKLFVGGLPYAVNDDQLGELFSNVGEVVSAKVIVDKFSGQSKGFGFVEMGSDDDAKKAISELDGKDFQGRSIAVSEARPQEPRPPRQFSNNGGGRDNRDRRY